MALVGGFGAGGDHHLPGAVAGKVHDRQVRLIGGQGAGQGQAEEEGAERRTVHGAFFNPAARPGLSDRRAFQPRIWASMSRPTRRLQAASSAWNSGPGRPLPMGVPLMRVQGARQ